MKTGKILIDFCLTKKSNECLSKFVHRLWQRGHSSSVTVNSKTRYDCQKQIAFLKSALKSMLIKKEK